MPYESFERIQPGRSDLEVTRLGFGVTSIGDLSSAEALIAADAPTPT